MERAQLVRLSARGKNTLWLECAKGSLGTVIETRWVGSQYGLTWKQIKKQGIYQI